MKSLGADHNKIVKKRANSNYRNDLVSNLFQFGQP